MNGIGPNTQLLIETAPMCLDSVLNRLALRPSELQDLERECDALTQRATLVSTYLGARGADGCGDHGHDAALRYAEKQVRRIRKTIGYTYP